MWYYFMTSSSLQACMTIFSKLLSIFVDKPHLSYMPFTVCVVWSSSDTSLVKFNTQQFIVTVHCLLTLATQCSTFPQLLFTCTHSLVHPLETHSAGQMAGCGWYHSKLALAHRMTSSSNSVDWKWGRDSINNLFYWSLFSWTLTYSSD